MLSTCMAVKVMARLSEADRQKTSTYSSTTVMPMIGRAICKGYGSVRVAAGDGLGGRPCSQDVREASSLRAWTWNLRVARIIRTSRQCLIFYKYQTRIWSRHDHRVPGEAVHQRPQVPKNLRPQQICPRDRHPEGLRRADPGAPQDSHHGQHRPQVQPPAAAPRPGGGLHSESPARLRDDDRRRYRAAVQQGGEDQRSLSREKLHAEFRGHKAEGYRGQSQECGSSGQRDRGIAFETEKEVANIEKLFNENMRLKAENQEIAARIDRKKGAPKKALTKTQKK